MESGIKVKNLEPLYLLSPAQLSKHYINSREYSLGVGRGPIMNFGVNYLWFLAFLPMFQMLDIHSVVTRHLSRSVKLPSKSEIVCTLNLHRPHHPHYLHHHNHLAPSNVSLIHYLQLAHFWGVASMFPTSSFITHTGQKNPSKAFWNWGIVKKVFSFCVEAPHEVLSETTSVLSEKNEYIEVRIGSAFSQSSELVYLF